MKRFEYNSHGILDRIVVPCTVDLTDYETNGPLSSKKKVVKALVDTGSTVTVLSELLVNELGIIPSDVSRVSGWDGRPLTTNTYNIDVLLDDVRIDYVNAVRGPLTNIDMIIGMDILGQGELHIIHPSLTTKLVFLLE